MKKTILMLTVLIWTLSLSAQETHRIRPIQHLKAPEKIQEVKRKMIQDSLNLTTEEATKFWPVYDRNEEAKAAIRLKYRSGRAVKDGKPDAENLSDDDIYKMIESRLDRKLEMATLDKKYYQELKPILPAKKIQRLFYLETKYKQHVIGKMNSEKRIDSQKPCPKDGNK
jgi:Spy/CpxP family protein refolding chaperone